MSHPLSAGMPLDEKTWRELRMRAMFACCKWDIQSEDHCVLAQYPLFLRKEDMRNLTICAEELAEETLCAERELVGRWDLHHELGLPAPILRALRRSENPPRSVARVMRFDFHFSTEGWKVSEVNCDVPGGFVESSGFTRLMGEAIGIAASGVDPAMCYCDALSLTENKPLTVALVHATAHSDDRQVWSTWRVYCETAGCERSSSAPHTCAGNKA